MGLIRDWQKLLRAKGLRCGTQTHCCFIAHFPSLFLPLPYHTYHSSMRIRKRISNSTQKIGSVLMGVAVIVLVMGSSLFRSSHWTTHAVEKGLLTGGGGGEVAANRQLDKTISSPSSSSSSLLTAHVHEASMKALRQHMMKAKETVPNFASDCVEVLLKYLRTKAPSMFPLLDTVPVTAETSGKNFVGQEKEDRDVYLRFFNEHTQQCHTFGKDGLFESGAYMGVLWSNTYFFETHFQIPSILVEASRDNWGPLDEAVKKHRPHASVHHAALCPLGDETVCLDNQAGDETAMHKVTRGDACTNSIPCFQFDDALDYSFISLDIEGFEWEFLKFRHLKADLILVEVVQWLRQPETLITAVEFTTYMVNLGYYLYASEFLVGQRNFLFVSQRLVDDCFADRVIANSETVRMGR